MLLRDLVGCDPLERCESLTVYIFQDDMDAVPMKLTPAEQRLMDKKPSKVPEYVREARRRTAFLEKVYYNSSQLGLFGMTQVKWPPSVTALMREERCKDKYGEKEIIQKEWEKMHEENAQLEENQERTIRVAKWRSVMKELKRVLVHQDNVTLYLVDAGVVERVFDPDNPIDIRLRSLHCISQLHLFPHRSLRAICSPLHHFLPSSLKVLKTSGLSHIAPDTSAFPHLVM